MGSLSGSSVQSLTMAFAGLGTIVHVLVLGALIVSSVVCWGIIFQKSRALRKAQRHSRRFLDALHSSNDVAFIAAAARRFALSPLARLFRTAHQRLEVLSEGRFAVAEEESFAMSAHTAERLRQILRVAQAEEVARLEQGLPFLATTASVAPFVGLFGTVWGIMESFHAIGQGGGASLAVVGPGISAALVATAVGLAAAIPAVVAYNHYLNRIRHIAGDLESFTEDLLLLFDSRIASEAPRVSHRPPHQR